MKEKITTKENPSTSAANDEMLEIRIPDVIKAIRKFWWLCLVLMIVGAVGFFFRHYVRFVPVYQSSVTFTVQTQELGNSNMGITSYSFSYNRATATQLASTFPSIIKSRILNDILCTDLGIPYIPCTLASSSVSGTNMFTVTATAPILAHA